MNKHINSAESSRNIFNEDDPSQPIRIVVIGVGGGGGNAVNTMIDSGAEGVQFVAANTDIQALAGNKAKLKVQLGKELTNGIGAGTDPEVGREAALQSVDEIKKALDGANLVFITLGMGGGTGSGASPVIAEIAQQLGALTIAVVTRPFFFEGRLRSNVADRAIEKLRPHVDAIVCISNDRVLEVASEDCGMGDAYALGDKVLRDSVQGIYEVITKRGYINCDFADVQTILRNEGGTALFGRGVSSGEGGVVKAATEAITSPLLDDVNVDNATRLLFNITSSSKLTVKEFRKGTKVIEDRFDTSKTKIVFGHVVDDTLDNSDQVFVTVVATGFPSEDAVEEPLPHAQQNQKPAYDSALQYDAPAMVQQVFQNPIPQPQPQVSAIRHTQQNRRLPSRITGQQAPYHPYPQDNTFTRDTREAEPAFVPNDNPNPSSLRASFRGAPQAVSEELPPPSLYEQAQVSPTQTHPFIRQSQALKPSQAASPPTPTPAAESPSIRRTSSSTKKRGSVLEEAEQYSMPDFSEVNPFARRRRRNPLEDDD